MKSKITIKDVAKEAGVSIATVSYVVNGVDKVAEDTKKKVLSAVNKLSYKPDINAVSLVKKESRIIGIIIPSEQSEKKSVIADNPFFQEFFTGVEYRAMEKDYTTALIGSQNAEELLEILNNNSLAGIILVGLFDRNIFKALSKCTFPIVALDQRKLNTNFSYINCDDYKGAYVATEYLINCGHKKIAYITGEPNLSIINEDRLRGYKDALKINNINFSEDAVFYCKRMSYDDGIEVSKDILNSIREGNKITSVFCMSDIVALGLIRGFHNFKVKVPEDISVIGFDNIKTSEYFIPGLTTIKQDIFYKGEKAVDVILNNINKNNKRIEEIVIDISLIERESVKSLL